MEIGYLQYEIREKEKSEVIAKGKMIYDPMEDKFIFYGKEENVIHSKKFDTVSLIPHYLRDNKLAFKDEEEKLIIIHCDVKDALELRTYRYLLSKIVEKEDKKAVKKETPDSKHIITKAKDYQLEILETAKKKNTIVFLETGLGKTYISILLIKDIFGEPVESNCINKIPYKKQTSKKVIFLFKTISLLIQQSKVLKHNTNLRVLRLYGGQDIHIPSHQKFKSLLERYDVLCATPETIYRYFTFGFITSADLALIVLDECHHAKDKDYYNLILTHFIQPFGNEVKILGLTASPSFDSDKSEEKITANIQTLCNNMNCYLACPSNIINEGESQMDNQMESEKEISFIHLANSNPTDSENLTDPKSEIKSFLFTNIILPFTNAYMKYKESTTFNFANENFEPLFYSSLLLTLYADEDKISEKINGIFDKEDYHVIEKFFSNESTFKPFLEKFKLEAEKSELEKVNFSREMREFQKKSGEDPIIKIIKKYVKSINFILKYVDIDSAYEHSKLTFQEIKLYNIEVLYKDNIIGETMLKVEELKTLSNYKSNYMSALEDFFKQMIRDLQKEGNKADIPKSIVFINQRLITKLLSEKMNRFLSHQGYSCRFVVGCQAQSSVPFSEEELKQNIDYFTANPTCLVLFATNVVEEGIDIPQCNNVINLTEIKTIKEFIQKSGRARKSDSKIFLCCYPTQAEEYKNKVDQIKLSIKVMKRVISENKIEPKVKKEKYIHGLNYYQTKEGARVYLSYAKKMVEEFIGKLFYDGYTYLKATMKVEEMTDKSGKILYRPYLSLPYVLESNFSKIFDSEETCFTSKDMAKKYFSKYEDYYYLKAVRLLHANQYLNDHLLFSKNYDDLMNIENSCSKFPSEPKIRLKGGVNKSIDNSSDFVEVTAHILEITPNYIDLNFESSDEQVLGLISDSPLTLINFDLYIHSTLLIKLYYFNNFHDDEEKKSKFANKPKIPYSVFTRLNVSMDKYQVVKVRRSDMPYIDFLYTYLLFSSTDAEIFFFHSLHMNKFEFSEGLFLSDEKVKAQLKFIFDNFSKVENKQHLNDFSNAQLGFANHMVKLSLMKIDQNGELVFDIEYMKKVVKLVKEDIEFYYRFINDCVESEENINMMLIDPEFFQEKERKLEEKRKDTPLPNCGILCRNMINYGKYFILNYGQTDLRGTSKYKKKEKNSKETYIEKGDYQQHFLTKYGVLTDKYRDYKKCLPLDYNQKVLKYKVNLHQVGKVTRTFHKVHYLKKFHFLPNEVIQPITFASMDQLYLFTLFPVILYKTQNSLIYYYQAHCLRQRFSSFNTLNVLDIRLLTSSLNSKSTLECENYERLEFLGDAILKFLSSMEVFKLYPEGNRDLLYSKRKVIENNKTLFNFAREEKNSIDQFLFTSPVTLKRINIPGFSHDETLMFNIGYNRSFAKSCFFKIQTGKKADEDMGNGIMTKAFNPEMFKKEEEKENTDELMLDEEKTEKTMINIVYDDNHEPVYRSNEVLVDDNLIDEVVNNKIEVSPGKSFRILYHKVLADLVESLTGFLFHTNVYTYKNMSNMFDKSSTFLKEIGLLNFHFQEVINNPFWMKDLLNPNCRFPHDQRYMKVKPIAENKRYTFQKIELLYQACTHCSYMSEESMKANFPYVRKSYQRLAFIGEAFVSFYVSLWVYNRTPLANEGMLHKLKICGVNHHIISLIAIDLKLDDCLLKNDRDIDLDLNLYKNKFLEYRSQSENKFRLKNETLLDENFIIILCELFHAYIGAILLDSMDVEKTYLILNDIMHEYLENNATLRTYTEHPKVIILDEFYKRRHYFKKLRENGSNRINMKNDKADKFRHLKMYKYQLIIDKFVIYEEYIYYNRSTIKVAQEKAKDVFLKVCSEIDKREKLGLHFKFFDLESILNHLAIPYEKIQI